jgi:hypothetical protein
MFKEVMNDLWLARISSLSNEVGLYVVLLEVLLFMPNSPSGHVITGDLNIIKHESLRKMISHGPKFREPQHINWKHNFKIITMLLV